MDAFTAATSFLPSASVCEHILRQQDVFRQQVGEETWQSFQHQQTLLETQSPSLTVQQIERLRIDQRNVLDERAIERMRTPYLLKTASEFNQPLIMANPLLANMHKLGQLEGYGLDVDPTRAKLLQNRIESGMVIERDGVFGHREYADSAGDMDVYNHLTMLERRITQQNQRTAISSVLDDIDFSSTVSWGF